MKFAPSTAATVQGSINVSGNDGFPPINIPVNAIGAVPAPVMSIATPDAGAGTVQLGTSQTFNISVANTGTAPLIISSVTTALPFAYVSPTAPFTVPAGSTTAMVLKFTPTSILPSTGTLTMTTNDPTQPTVKVPLSGSGTGLLACTFSLGADIYAKWKSMGLEKGPLGCPLGNEVEAPASSFGTTGRSAPFENGSIMWLRTGNQAGQAFAIVGCMENYKAALGFAASDTFPVQYGTRTDFEGGYILYNTSGDECSVYYRPYDLSGNWTTDRGTLNLSQDGLTVTGSYRNGSIRSEEHTSELQSH